MSQSRGDQNGSHTVRGKSGGGDSWCGFERNAGCGSASNYSRWAYGPWYPDLPGQDITPVQHIAFGKQFGELTIHPFSPSLPDTPELIILDNDLNNPPRLTDVWHTDDTFRGEPPMGTILRAVIVP